VNDILNISSYKFVDIDDPQGLCEPWLTRALDEGLKGTILLAQEGVNLFLAGPESAVRAFVGFMHQDARFADITPKESWSDTQPFKRMRVKCKREIIRMDHPTIRPAGGRAPSVRAETVKRWLDQGHDDQGRPVVTLDTRNAFEVDAGAFEGAIDWRITRFGEFPAAAQAHRAELEGKTVVSYCTGGIRCEKAAIYLKEMGLESVYQLEGGILKYFEEVGGAHYRGDCFVFDERVGLAPDLSAAR
jgi:UPF0176 protein